MSAGGSGASAGDYSFDLLIGDTVGLWDALAIDRSALVGIGLGGMTAMGLALEHRDRVSALIPSACRASLTPDYEAIWPPLIATAREKGVAGVAEMTATRWFPEAFREANPELMDKIRTMIRGTSPEGYFGCIAALLTLDIGDAIAGLDMPTLFVSGALDAIGGPPAMMQGMCDQVPGARHVTLADAGHICNMANPEAYSAAVLEFLKEGV